MRNLLVLFTAGAATVLLGAASAQAETVAHSPTQKVSFSAKIIVGGTHATSTPGGNHVVARLSTRGPLYGNPMRLLVLDTSRVNGDWYYKLRLPARPNDKDGWVSANEVLVSKNTSRVVVDVSSARITLLRNGHRAASSRIVVGNPRTPTPTGLFAILETVPQPRGSILGSYVAALTAHSNVHKTFDGGDGRIGMHGYERLGNSLGSHTSNGCIRMPESFLRRIVRLPSGTPVQVQS